MYYYTAADAMNNDNQAANICYGWDLLMSEGEDSVRGAWMNSVADNIGNDVMTCEHGAVDCERMFHAAQVILGNEDEDECDVCKTWGA
jgi:hypothetical protein